MILLLLLAQSLPERWITDGPDCTKIPDWQVHEYNPGFYILRESGCTHYEKPFLYLLFGKERALLEDTGAGKPETAKIVSSVVATWLERNKRESIPLIVAHSHGHSDHIAGDIQFTNVVPLTVEGSAQFFRIQKNFGKIDLGDRVIDMIAIPGHEKLSIALYDRQTGVLLTGDSLYPGRLYVPVGEFGTFADSIQRLVDFTEGKRVTHVLGTHIEQTRTPYVDYPVGTKYQPEEHSLELGRAHLLELNLALKRMRDKPLRLALRDFTIWPVEPPR